MSQLQSRRILPFAAALAIPLALAACGKSSEPTYEADATDESGGQLIVQDADSAAVPVNLPETPMTPVPAEGSPTPAPSPSASASPAAK